MLYNPKWEKRTRTEPPLAGLIAWLETKDPNETYEWDDCRGRCLIGQYGASIGLSWKAICLLETGTHDETLYKKLTPNCLALTHPHTFGAALERARASLELSRKADERHRHEG